MSVLRIGSAPPHGGLHEKYLSPGFPYKTWHQLLIKTLNSSPDDPLKKLLAP